MAVETARQVRAADRVLLLQLLVLLVEVLEAFREHQVGLGAHAFLFVHLRQIQIALKSVEVLVTIYYFRDVQSFLVAFDGLVLLAFLDEYGGHFDVVLQHHFIVGLV